MFSHRLDDDRRLRLATEVDAAELYALTDANRARLGAWMPWAAEATLETTNEFIRERGRAFAAGQGFAALIVEDDAIVGTVGFANWDAVNRACEIGYWIDDGAGGRGTVTLAVAALLGHAFGEREMHRAVIRAGVDNERSRAVAERLGFTLEGVARECERYPDGHYVDLAVYALLAPQWRR